MDHFFYHLNTICSLYLLQIQPFYLVTTYSRQDRMVLDKTLSLIESTECQYRFPNTLLISTLLPSFIILVTKHSINVHMFNKQKIFLYHITSFDNFLELFILHIYVKIIYLTYIIYYVYIFAYNLYFNHLTCPFPTYNPS